MLTTSRASHGDIQSNIFVGQNRGIDHTTRQEYDTNTTTSSRYPPGMPEYLQSLYDYDASWEPRSTRAFNSFNKVGEGSYGAVYRGTLTKDPSVNIALKEYQIDVEMGLSVTTLREIQLLSQVKSPNVVNVQGVISTSSTFSSKYPMNIPRHPTTISPYEKSSAGFKHTIISLAHLNKSINSSNALATANATDRVEQPHPVSVDLKNSGVGHIIMAMEYCSTDLSKLCQLSTDKLPPDVIQYFIHQILLGLRDCHEQGVLHRDIKPSNILIDESGCVKLADFGLARRIIPNLKYTGQVVTLWYRAPEVLLMLDSDALSRPISTRNTMNYDDKVDIWSVGCILAELILGKVLFQAGVEMELMSKIFSLCGKPDEKSWPHLNKLLNVRVIDAFPSSQRKVQQQFCMYEKSHPTGLTQFIDALLQPNPDNRPTAEQALKMDYFVKQKPLTTDEFRAKYRQTLADLNLPLSHSSSQNNSKKITFEPVDTYTMNRSYPTQQQQQSQSQYMNSNSTMRNQFNLKRRDRDRDHNAMNQPNQSDHKRARHQYSQDHSQQHQDQHQGFQHQQYNRHQNQNQNQNMRQQSNSSQSNRYNNQRQQRYNNPMHQNNSNQNNNNQNQDTETLRNSLRPCIAYMQQHGSYLNVAVDNMEFHQLTHWTKVYAEFLNQNSKKT